VVGEAWVQKRERERDLSIVCQRAALEAAKRLAESS